VPVEHGAQHLAVLRIEDRGPLRVGEACEGVVGRDEERPTALRLALRPILVGAAGLHRGDERREPTIRHGAQGREQIRGRSLLHLHLHLLLGALLLRQHDAVDDMDDAVAAADVGAHHERVAKAEACGVCANRLAVARGGPRHLRDIDVADPVGEQATGHHVVGEDVAQALLVLGKEQRLERTLRERCERLVGWCEDGEGAGALERVDQPRCLERTGERGELGRDRGVHDVRRRDRSRERHALTLDELLRRRVGVERCDGGKGRAQHGETRDTTKATAKTDVDHGLLPSGMTGGESF
jgi:hypothetical protein